MRSLQQFALIAATFAIATSTAYAQIDLVPKTAQPTIWERFTLRVINQREPATVEVVLVVPEVVAVLGVQAPSSAWKFEVIAPTDSTPQMIRWTGGSVGQGSFDEFAFLGRIPGDARSKELVFPVTLRREDGSETQWSRLRGEGVAPVVQIVGTTSVTPWGAVGLAGGAFGIAVIALALAVSARQPRS